MPSPPSFSAQMLERGLGSLLSMPIPGLTSSAVWPCSHHILRQVSIKFIFVIN